MQYKRLIYLVADALLVSVALLAALLLRFGLGTALSYMQELLFLLPQAILIKLTVYHVFRFHSQLWQYVGLRERLRLPEGISITLFPLGHFFVRRSRIPQVVIGWCV